MTNDLLSANDFIVLLRHICESEVTESVSLDIDSSETWPHFRIACNKEHTAAIRGYYVENGDSFWQVSESGHEVFTGNAASAREFVEDISAVIYVLIEAGCTEIKWKNRDGNLIRSEIHIQANGRRLIFGKPPAFWQRGLVKEQFAFVPYRYCPK